MSLKTSDYLSIVVKALEAYKKSHDTETKTEDIEQTLHLFKIMKEFGIEKLVSTIKP